MPFLLRIYATFRPNMALFTRKYQDHCFGQLLGHNLDFRLNRVLLMFIYSFLTSGMEPFWLGIGLLCSSFKRQLLDWNQFYLLFSLLFYYYTQHLGSPAVGVQIGGGYRTLTPTILLTYITFLHLGWIVVDISLI